MAGLLLKKTTSTGAKTCSVGELTGVHTCCRRTVTEMTIVVVINDAISTGNPGLFESVCSLFMMLPDRAVVGGTAAQQLYQYGPSHARLASVCHTSFIGLHQVHT